ncbi:DUF4181 domain-containing protein [Evansella sp. LMS18]|uniref:DUF4181 domain-containing protein n=1 Tax=Evansella sp. LMS18 TaxID=2924033 RepID=UPI0020D1154F|nr:DUF4181 domain-containing protein [Evansella sp. LMS18]UTR12649.1 DUF4181 domain-containing protein [Evansella sp. LMS18]
MTTVFVFIFLFAVIVLIEHFWKKRLRGDEEVKISDTPGRKMDFWGRVIISVSCIIMLIFVFSLEGTEPIKWFFAVYFLLLYGFQAFMEWKYLKGSKEYIATLTVLAVGLIFVFNIEAILNL